MINRFKYVEIRNPQLELVGIIDDATSMIWHSVYYGCGDFEIVATATAEAKALLVDGNFVSRYDSPDIGIIEGVEPSMNDRGEKALIARGRFAKVVIERRLIYQLNGSTNTATVFSGDVQAAARKLVSDNAINCSFDSRRNIPILRLGAVDSSITAVVVDSNGKPASKQVSYQNLMSYTDALLQEHELGARVTLADDASALLYSCYKGVDRSADYIFSAEFDNLLSARKSVDDSQLRTTALIGGEGEGTERFYSLIGGDVSGLARREVFIDDSSISRTYKDGDTEMQYSDSVYKSMLDADARQKLADMKKIEAFDCAIDLNRSALIFGQHFNLGDIVTVMDNELNVYAAMRFLEITEVRDSGGYNIDAKMGA